MGSATHSYADAQTREAVMRQIESDPQIDDSAIGVAAHDGAVVLSGFIDTYPGKLAAERAAKRVAGVRAVANELQVRLRFPRADDELAADLAHVLAMRHAVPESVQATVKNGHVTLTGAVPWMFHRTAAQLAVRNVPGVLDVTNRITVTPAVVAVSEVRHRIAEALHRVAEVNTRRVDVTVKGTAVTLGGQVTSWAQRSVVERAAAEVPGITRVENLIEVDPGIE